MNTPPGTASTKSTPFAIFLHIAPKAWKAGSTGKSGDPAGLPPRTHSREMRAGKKYSNLSITIKAGYTREETTIMLGTALSGPIRITRRRSKTGESANQAPLSKDRFLAGEPEKKTYKTRTTITTEK